MAVPIVVAQAPRGSREIEGLVCAVGVDLVAVPRFARMLAMRGPDLTTRVFTPAEQRTCAGDVHRLAARLAAKEATAKALGTGIGPIGWCDVEVLTRPDGSPDLRLAGAALVRARASGFTRWHVSLSHEATHAIALVVLLGEELP